MKKSLSREKPVAVSLKNVKVHKDMSEETTCFSATVLVDGKPIGTVENRGTGGCNFYHWTNQAAGKRLEDWAETQPLEFDFDHLDQIVSHLLDRQETLKQLTRWCRKETLFRLKGDKKGSWRTLKTVFEPRAEKWIRDKYGDRVEIIANSDLEAATAY